MTAITIGIPVLNGSKSIGKAIESAISQSNCDWKMVVSDNASTDDTRKVVEHYAQSEKRISIKTLPKTVSAVENFGCLVNQIDTRYFVFLAADDYWSPNFLLEAQKVLDTKEDVFLVTGRVKLGNRFSAGTFSIADRSSTQRVRQYLKMPSDNSRYYGLMRSQLASNIFSKLPKEPFYAYDWLQMAISLRHGKHHEINNILLHRTPTPIPKYFDIIRSEKFLPFRWLPLGRFSYELFRNLPTEAILCAWEIAVLNYQILSLKNSARKPSNSPSVDI